MIKAVETSKIWHGGEITKDMYTELQQGMIQSAERIATKARILCPYGIKEHKQWKGTTPGHLRDTIRARGKRKKTLVEKLIHAAASSEYETALPGAFVFAGDRSRGIYWAHYVEFGTYFKPAHPYMRPATDANFDATLAEAERAGKRALNKRRRARARTRRMELGGVR